VASLALFILAKRYIPKFPIMLVVLAAAGAIAYFTGYSAHGAVVGPLPSGLPQPYWPARPGWDQFSTLLAPALVLTLVSSLEMASSARSNARRTASAGTPARTWWARAWARWCRPCPARSRPAPRSRAPP
jgi:SulP family sulfate permease